MATTTLLQRHAGEGETIAEAIRDCLDYGKDPEKTESGKYISAYECDPATVADEFLLAKASYAAMTGAVKGGGVVINVTMDVLLVGMCGNDKRVPPLCPAHSRYGSPPSG